MDKRTVADVLSRLAFAREVLDGPTPEARQLGTAARAVWQLEGDLAEAHASGGLARMRMVGKDAAAIVGEVLAGREPPELAALEAKIPAGVFELRRIKGLGPAKIRALFQGLAVTSLAELELACKENRLVELEGFGKKTQANVLGAITEIRANEGKLLRDAAAERLAPVLAALRAELGVRRVEVVGQLARGMEVVERLELVVAGEPDAVERARAAAGVTDGAAGGHGAAVVVETADDDALGALALARTSSPEHFAALTAHAASRGLVLAADGLTRDGAAVATPDVDAVYAALGLVPTAPERREPGVPLVLVGHAAPRLVTRKDLLGALHNHTVASDGTATLEEMRDAAREAGLSYLGISEHSQSADYARGLTVPRLAAQREEIARLVAGDPDGPAVLTGVESDILADGALDYPREVLAALDVVIASGHRRFGLDRDASTARMVRAARDPSTDIVGHPTGRLLLGRPPNDFDVEAFLDACAESGCAVELNGSPHRLDLDEHWLAKAKERGVPVSIAADAHATSELGYLEHGVTIARRAGLGPEDVLNARTLDELRAWLAARRATRSTA